VNNRFSCRPVYPRGKSPCTHSNRELGESHSLSGHFGNEENLLSLPGNESNFRCCPVRSVFRPFSASLSDIRQPIFFLMEENEQSHLF
jgi:hypothetical protein